MMMCWGEFFASDPDDFCWAIDQRRNKWIWRDVDGKVWEGPLGEDKENGGSVDNSANRDVAKESSPSQSAKVECVYDSVQGEALASNPATCWVNDNRNGMWAVRAEDGVSEGTYVDGKKNGHWVTRFATAMFRKDYMWTIRQAVIGFGVKQMVA